MSCPQLNEDCINEIFKYFVINTLYSCLFVNRRWCEKAVSYLWKNIWDYSLPDKSHVAIISTLISCLPNESKALLSNNGITPTLKSPFFQYASLCDVISIHKIDLMIQNALRSITSTNLNFKKDLLLQELLNMFMTQISSLKGLKYESTENFNVTQSYFPEAENCLTKPPEFFHQLAQTFHNIQTLTIKVETPDDMYWTKIIPSLTNHSASLTELYIGSLSVNVPISFIGKFKNLQKLVLEFTSGGLDVFTQLQHVKFQRLIVLKFLYECPKVEMLIQFLENNGTNLKELYVESNDNSLNLSIARFCPNLKSLFTIFDEIETLKEVLNSCKYLESIKVCYRKGIMEVIANHSPKNFYKLALEIYDSEILPEELESFFINWRNRKSQKSISFIMVKLDFGVGEESKECEETMKIIEKYKIVIKKPDKGEE